MSATCCCHDFDEPCGYGMPERHIHRCLPRALDLGGHCPDGACPGDCWLDPHAARLAAQRPTPAPTEES